MQGFCHLSGKCHRWSSCTLKPDEAVRPVFLFKNSRNCWILLKVINENWYHQEKKLLHHTNFVEDTHYVNCSKAKPNMTTMSTKTPLAHFVEGIHSVSCSKTKHGKNQWAQWFNLVFNVMHKVSSDHHLQSPDHPLHHEIMTVTGCYNYSPQTSSSAVRCGYIRSVYNDLFQIPGKQLCKNLHHDPEFLFWISGKQLSYTKICIQYVELIFHLQKQQEDRGRLSSDVS